MIYRLASYAVATVHYLFILFAAIGAVGILWWPGLVWGHVAVLVYTALIGIFGWTCPLTPMEAAMRQKGGLPERGADFVEHFFMPILFPKFIFPNGYPNHAFAWACVFVLVLNGLIYAWIYWTWVYGVFT